MADPLFRITDGTTYVNLLDVNSGFLLDDWIPAIAGLKGGGTYQSSALSDGQQLISAQFGTVVETITVKTHGYNQDSLIRDAQNLMRLLEKARDYWVTGFSKEPVYIEARGPNETNTRYAVIHNYTLDHLANPYTQPFFACIRGAIDNVTIILERGHWLALPPRDSECVPLYSYYFNHNYTQIWDLYACSVDWRVAYGATPYFNEDDDIIVGIDSFVGYMTTMAIGMRFTINVDSLAENAKILDAHLVLDETGSSTTSSEYYVTIEGELDYQAAAVTSYNDHYSRPRTSNKIKWHWVAGGAGTTHVSPNIASIIQEIIDLPGYDQGIYNYLNIFIEYTGTPENAENLISFEDEDADTYNEPRLFIASALPEEEIETCDAFNFVTNGYIDRGVDMAYRYDASGTSYTQIVSSGLLLPDPPAAGDIFYVGCLYPWNTVVLDIDVPGFDINGVWEYYQGNPTNDWTAIPANRYIDGTFSFQNTRPAYFHWRPSMDSTNGDWAASSVNGGPNYYWVRFRVTSVGVTLPTSPTIASSITLASHGCVTIPAGNIEGDIPALGAIQVGNESFRSTSLGGDHYRDRVILAIRSDRGPWDDITSDFFNAYMPLSNHLNTIHEPAQVKSCTLSSGQLTFVTTDVTASAGNCVNYSPTGTGTQTIKLLIDSSYFFGTYRMFVRARQLDSSTDGFFVKVKLESYTYNASAGVGIPLAETQEVAVEGGMVGDESNPYWQLLDLGTLNIPADLDRTSGMDTGDLYLVIYIRCTNTAPDLRINDLIAMPADEWICDARDLSGYSFIERELIIDSLTSFRQEVTSSGKASFSGAGAMALPWKIIGGKLEFPANVGFKIWYLDALYESTTGAWLSDPNTAVSIRAYKNEQYLGMRGDR